VPVFTDDELAAMLATCKGGGFQNRRDYAVISLFKDAGIRLSELAGLAVADVSPATREAVITGKGDKQRTVRFTYDTSRALDRYTRERARHRLARVPALWLGVRSGAMTASGIYQLIERRGKQAGVEVNPHKFRHHFSHVLTTYVRHPAASSYAGPRLLPGGPQVAALLKLWRRAATLQPAHELQSRNHRLCGTF
jgi:site-specific recombinase XerD